MDRDDLLAALAAVGQQLLHRGLQGDLYVVGGAAMALAYDRERTTRDVDDLFAPKQAVYAAAAVVAADRGRALDLVERVAGERWLTPQVQFFVQAVLEPGVEG